MNIADYRSSFTVYVLDSDLGRGRSLANALADGGYKTQHILSETSFKEEIRKDPPHILLFFYEDRVFAHDSFAAVERIQSLLARLPELHIIVLAETADLVEVSSLYAEGIYAALEYPAHPEVELLKSVDRAAQQGYYVFLNEQLSERKPDATSAGVEIFELWTETFKTSKNPLDWIRNTLKEFERVDNHFQYIYFKYVPSRTSLVAEDAVGIDPSLLDSVGIDLRSSEPHFRIHLLLDPQKLVGLNDLVRNGLQKRHFVAWPCIADHRIDGVVVAISKHDHEEPQQVSYFRNCLRFLGSQLALLELRNKLNKFSVVDESSSALNRAFFIQKIEEEIVRARRILRPVSLLIIQVDDFHQTALTTEEFELDRFLTSLTSIVVKNSRLNDLLGRLGPDQFGVLLPHTDRKGAAVKAERLRRITESADFAKVFPQKPKITISVGVSEYPSVAGDGSQLLRKADEALLEVVKFSKNKVCLASPNENYEPDFQVRENQ